MDFGLFCGNGLVMIGILCVCCVVSVGDGPEMVGVVCICGAGSVHGLVKGESMWVYVLPVLSVPMTLCF